jgi:molybdate transport system ATP-binding protein
MSELPALDARLSIDVGRGARTFHVDAEVSGQGVLVLFGPSGVGKTVTLQALCGLLPICEGHIRLGGESLLDTAAHTSVPPHMRRIGYVPQQQSLFPFLDVAGNVAFGVPRPLRRKEHVLALLEELGIAGLAAAAPSSLSGGERQRVALARSLAVSPRMLLLDEPFASIDADGRKELRRVVRDVIDRRSIPAVLVTHDPDDARAIGDRVVRFERGKTVECGTPAALLGRQAGLTVSGVIAYVNEGRDGERRARLLDAFIEGPDAVVRDGPVSLACDPQDPT